MWLNTPNTFILRECRSKRRSTFVIVTILGCLIISFLFSYASFGQEIAPKISLVSVHILFRHGDRLPTFSYPTDPYKKWKGFEEKGALTNKGKQQMYVLGKLIRSRYSFFLPELYSSRDLFVKSSYAPRCQMSAAVLLAGLFPPVGFQIWNEQLLWQPIPVNSIPRDRDNLIAAKAYCPAFNEEKKISDVELTEELKTQQKEFNLTEVFDYISGHTGMKIADIDTAESLYYTLSIQEDNDLKLPSWTDKIYPEPLRTIAGLNLASFTRTDHLKRLQSGPLFGEWLANVEYSQKGNSPLMYIYSGHDLTIINTMRSLGLISGLPWLPEYGASFIVELHKNIASSVGSAFFLKFFYLNSSSSSNFNELKLPTCDLQCSLNMFKKLLKPLVPDNWNNECNHIA